MTRKHYIAIADAVRRCELDEDSRAMIIDSLVSVLQGDNPRFDRARFLQACGVQNI